jgi:large subunit ribosomal protein L21
MYAVIKAKGKQYRVEPGATVRVDKIDGEKGAKLTFDEVLLVADGEDVKVGTPHLKGAKVSAEIVAQVKGPKLVVFKFRRRKAYRKRTGHRQPYTTLKITGITGTS